MAVVVSLMAVTCMLSLLQLQGAGAAVFTLTNRCPFTLWPGILSGSTSTPLSPTGLELPPGASTAVTAPTGWSGRFWARTWCSNAPTSATPFTCATGDCGTGQLTCNGAGGALPATLAEFTLNGDGGKDFYDISLVDGFNVPLSITAGGNCPAVTCATDVNKVCPSELQAKTADGGSVVGCRSPCAAFGRGEFCCTGAFGSPQTCGPTDYSRVFKSSCPQAYSYPYDDATSTFTCAAGADYQIVFCP